MANSGNGYAYINANIGVGAQTTGTGFSYSTANIGYTASNSQVAYAYSYVNIIIYVLHNDNLLPPMIN
ncbi:MAG: hypothetical protein ABI221_02130 [Candidatus Saccharimonadales bacterium]